MDRETIENLRSMEREYDREDTALRFDARTDGNRDVPAPVIVKPTPQPQELITGSAYPEYRVNDFGEYERS